MPHGVLSDHHFPAPPALTARQIHAWLAQCEISHREWSEALGINFRTAQYYLRREAFDLPAPTLVVLATMMFAQRGGLSGLLPEEKIDVSYAQTLAQCLRVACKPKEEWSIGDAHTMSRGHALVQRLLGQEENKPDAQQTPTRE